jgi:hypothetical protein
LGSPEEQRRGHHSSLIHRNTSSLPQGSEFIDDNGGVQDHELMARLTGNYRQGNERQARNHPRNHH